MRKALSPVGLLAVVFLAACSSQSAIAPRTVKKLHSGSMVVVMPHKYLLLSQTGSPGYNAEVATAGVLGGAIGGLVAGFITPPLAPAVNAPLLKPYVDEIKTMPLRGRIISLARQASVKVTWLRGPSRVKGYDRLPKGSSARTFAEASNYDAVVFVYPHVYLSRDLRNLLVVLHIEAFARGRSEPTLIGEDNLMRMESMDNAKTKGEEAKLRLACLDRQHPRVARKACAKLWFARNAFFLRSALVLDMTYLEKDLSDYLNGKQDSVAKSG